MGILPSNFEHSEQCIYQKRLNLWTDKCTLNHDSMPFQEALSAKQFLASIRTSTAVTYLPTCDLSTFQKTKFLRGFHFELYEDIQSSMMTIVKGHFENDFRPCFWAQTLESINSQKANTKTSDNITSFIECSYLSFLIYMSLVLTCIINALNCSGCCARFHMYCCTAAITGPAATPPKQT